MIDDPDVRADGRCARYPACRKKLQPPTKYSGYKIDPFCSTECCKAAYGVPLPSTASASGVNPPQAKSAAPVAA